MHAKTSVLGRIVVLITTTFGCNRKQNDLIQIYNCCTAHTLLPRTVSTAMQCK